MNIFNSLGSNYNFNFVLKALTSYDRLVYLPEGKASSAYHTELQKYLQDKYNGEAVLQPKVELVYKGREAIELALRTLNLPKDSFVAINGFTCFAVYEAVKKAGLNVEYLDIDRGDLNFSPAILQEKIKANPKMNKFSSSKIKVVIVQNTLGYPCEIEQIEKICQENKIILIEDLAHCVGGKYKNGKEMGTVGDFGVFSFSQDKMVDGISGGSLIVKNGSTSEEFTKVSTNQQLKDRFYPLLTFLIRKTYAFGLGKILHFIVKNLKLLSQPLGGEDKIHQLPGWYGKLIKLQFDKLNDNLNHRKIIASIYAKLINPKILSPKIVEQISLSTNLRFPIFVRSREGLIKYLAQQGIYISDIWYDAPIAPKKYLSQTDYSSQCPNAEMASAEILNLPTHLNVKEKDAEKISELVNQWLKSK